MLTSLTSTLSTATRNDVLILPEQVNKTFYQTAFPSCHRQSSSISRRSAFPAWTETSPLVLIPITKRVPINVVTDTCLSNNLPVERSS
jgi:hypothetical protein